MRPNEVMIGDWVRFTDPDTNETELHRISQEDFSGNDKFWDCFSSIEITPEILEANGFEKHKEHWDENPFYLRWFSEIDGLDVHFSFYLDYATGTKFLFFQNEGLPKPVRFVHQLQNALRVMGLDDLADNFIIEKGGTQ